MRCGRIVVAMSDPDTRKALVARLRDEGHAVADFDTTLPVVVALTDELLDDARPRPACIVLDAVPHPRLAASLATGLRELGWVTPIVFAARDCADAAAFSRVMPPVRVVSDATPTRLAKAVQEMLADAPAASPQRAVRGGG